MAREENLQCITVEASADLSAKQFHFMTVNSSGQLAATGDGLKCDGVLQNKPTAAGHAGTLAIGGVTKVVAGGSVSAGADVASDTNGRAVAATTTGDVVLGRALEASTGNGQVISLLIARQYEPAA